MKFFTTHTASPLRIPVPLMLLSLAFLVATGATSFAQSPLQQQQPRQLQQQQQPPPAPSPDMSWFQDGWAGIKSAWFSKQWDIYVPFYEWHIRWAYGDDVRKYNYNENAWGIGVGKSCINARGNRYSLFVMGFLDSFEKIEPQAGVMWQKIWRGSADAWRVTLGAAAGFTARSDLNNYMPFPFVLPVFGVEYRRLSLECTYVPPLTFLELDERGNILLLWLRWRL